MKRKYKLIFVFVTLVIIVLSTFVVAVQYEVIDVFKEEEKMPLSVKIFADAPVGVVPHRVTFSSIVLNYEGDVNYRWDLGNGNTSEGKNPTATYLINDIYRCNLTVTDDSGEKVSDSIVITAEPIKMQTPGIEIEPRHDERPFKGYPKLMFLSSLLRNKLYGKFDLRERLVVNMIEKPEYKPLKEFFFSGVDGRVTCTAQVSNPEDVETYVWTLIGPNYVGPPPKGGIFRPNSTFTTENNTVTFPAIYTYRAGGYSVILELKDSNGKVIGINDGGFEVNPSNTKMYIEGIKALIFVTILGFLTVQWKQTWSKDPTGPIYKKVEEMLNKILEWPFPLASAITLRILEMLMSANVLDVWNKIPEEWAEFYKVQIDRGIMNENRVKERLEQHIDDIENKNLKGILLSIWCGLLRLDYEKVQQELGFINLEPKISSPSPENNAYGISPNCQKVFINVTDPEGDTIKWVNITGKYVDDSYYQPNVGSGIFNATLNIPKTGKQVEVNWHVEVVDHENRTVTRDYKFYTDYE